MSYPDRSISVIVGPIGPPGPVGPPGPPGSGPVGPQGPIGPQGVGSIQWQGAWSSGSGYSTTAVVTYNGSAYFATGNSLNQIPASDSGAHWQLLVAQGPQGPIGPQGPTGVGTTQFLGAWSSLTSYLGGNVVTRGGSTYYAVFNSINVDPLTDNGVNWALLAQAGSAGATGASGSIGPQGLTGQPGQGLIWMGNWSSATAYTTYMVVQYFGVAYISVINGNVGNFPSFSSSQWQVLAYGATGATGPQGPTGSTGASGQGFLFRGAWSSVTLYSPYDIVTENGSAWVAQQTGTNHDPATDNGTNWLILASKGSTGSQGPTGVAGSWLGAWSSATAYVTTNLVSRSGSSYVAVANSTNVDPATDGGSNWQLVASKGDAGSLGLTTFNTFTIPAVGSTVVVTVGSNANILTNQVHLLTDGTKFIRGSVTNVSGTSITYSNNGGAGGSTSGTMGNGIVWLTGSIPFDNNTLHFVRGDNTLTTIPSSGSGTLGIKPSNDVQIFTTTGPFTWTKPTVGTPITVEILTIGAGNGGGSGGYAAAGTAVGGGGGGSGGCMSRISIPASILPATVNGSVGAGGAGGLAKTSVGAGNNGAAYSSTLMDSWFGDATVTNPQYCYASGGNSGVGGPVSTAAASGGGNSNLGMFNGTAGGAGSANGAAATSGGNNQIATTAGGAGGGGGGGGFSTGNSEVAGAAGASSPSWMAKQPAGGLGGAVHASPGPPGTVLGGAYLPGPGGGGGGSSNTAATAGGTGAAGGLYGGGGGGGGAGDAQNNGVGSGAGGAGANGCVVVTTSF